LIVNIFIKISTLKLSANTFINTVPKIRQELNEAHHKTLTALSPVTINTKKSSIFM